MVMIFENLKKKVDAFAKVVWWSTYQQILKRIGQPCFRTVLHGFLIDKLLTASPYITYAV
jgi:hypothetical protein